MDKDSEKGRKIYKSRSLQAINEFFAATSADQITVEIERYALYETSGDLEIEYFPTFIRN